LDAGGNTILELGINTGTTTVDSSLLVYGGIDFGSGGTAGAYDTTSRLDSAVVRTFKQVVNDSIKGNKGRWSIIDSLKNSQGRFAQTTFVPAINTYGRPTTNTDSLYLTTGHWMDSATGQAWDWTDSTHVAAKTDYVYQDIVFPDSMLVDSLSFVYMTGAADSTLGFIDTIKIYKKWTPALATVIADTLKATLAHRAFSTTALHAYLAVNGATGLAVQGGEIWTVKFRNRFALINSKVRVMGLCAKGRLR
jgi:hypothetical protein